MQVKPLLQGVGGLGLLQAVASNPDKWLQLAIVIGTMFVQVLTYINNRKKKNGTI